MAKPTMSKDGNFRMNIRVDFRIDLDLVRCVVGKCFSNFCKHTINGIQHSIILDDYIKNRKDIEYFIRNQLKDNGLEESIDEYSDHMELLGFDGWREDGEQRPYWADLIDEKIKKYYPEFFK